MLFKNVCIYYTQHDKTQKIKTLSRNIIGAIAVTTATNY